MAAINRKWIGNYVYQLHDSNEIPKATPMFLGSGNTDMGYWEYCPMSGYVINQRWRPLTGSR